MIGLWIDSLTDEERDRIVEAKEWRQGRVGVPGGPRCLVGHALAVVPDDEKGILWSYHQKILGWPKTGAIEARFDVLGDRFGLERVVRAIKIRAGADLSDLESPRESSETPSQEAAYV